MSDLPAYRVDVTYPSGATFTYHTYRVAFTRRGLRVEHTQGIERVTLDGFKAFRVEPVPNALETHGYNADAAEERHLNETWGEA